VPGFELPKIDQVHESLFNTDLLREALSSDATGEVPVIGEDHRQRASADGCYHIASERKPIRRRSGDTAGWHRVMHEWYDGGGCLGAPAIRGSPAFHSNSRSIPARAPSSSSLAS